MRSFLGIVAGIVVGLVFAVFSRRNPWSQVKRELKAREAAAAVEEKMLQHGATVARRQVQAEHAALIRTFDYEQKERVKKLRLDPVALARWLTRISS